MVDWGGVRRIRGLIVAARIPSASQAAMVKSLFRTRPVNHILAPKWFFYAETSERDLGRADKCHLLLPGNSLPHSMYDAIAMGFMKMQPLPNVNRGSSDLCQVGLGKIGTSANYHGSPIMHANWAPEPSTNSVYANWAPIPI